MVIQSQPFATKRRTVSILASAVMLLTMHQAFAQDQPKSEGSQQPSAKKDKDKEKSKFVRIRRDDDGEPVALETAVVQFTKVDGDGKTLQVDLLGAVHIGDKSYYKELNRRFDDYEALLYELVAPKGTKIRKGDARRSGSTVAGFQRGMKSMLGLEFQLDHIDYSKKNFIHADMTPKEFANSMKNRDESFFKMYMRMVGYNAAMQAKNPSRSSDFNLLRALFAKDRTTQLKRVMAEQFDDLELAMGGIDGPNGSTIITERNKRAFEVLDRQIAAGQRRIGIFYGAGHFPDMQKRLLEDYGMKVTKTDWIPAWSLTSADKD